MPIKLVHRIQSIFVDLKVFFKIIFIDGESQVSMKIFDEVTFAIYI